MQTRGRYFMVRGEGHVSNFGPNTFLCHCWLVNYRTAWVERDFKGHLVSLCAIGRDNSRQVRLPKIWTMVCSWACSLQSCKLKKPKIWVFFWSKPKSFVKEIILKSKFLEKFFQESLIWIFCNHMLQFFILKYFLLLWISTSMMHFFKKNRAFKVENEKLHFYQNETSRKFNEGCWFCYRWFRGIYFCLIGNLEEKLSTFVQFWGRMIFQSQCFPIRQNTSNSHPSLILRSPYHLLWLSVAELWVLGGRITKEKHCAVRAIELLASG